MRRAITLALIVVVAAAPVQVVAADDPHCPAPRCRDLSVPVPSTIKVPDSTVRVLLPAGYAKTHRRYPVLYLLHGVGDSFKTWTQMTDVVALTQSYDLIVVMPDSGSGPNAGWYSDWKDGSRQWETFHTKVLIPFIDRTFRTSGRKHRAIAGASMGGFGAMKYAARHRRAFVAAASFSGYVDTMFMAPLSGAFYHYGGQGLAGQSLGTPNENVWGDQMSDEERWRAHNPADLAAKLKGKWLFVASGMGTPGGEAGDDPSRPHSYLSETFVWQVNESFTAALDDVKVAYTSEFYNGYHHWPYWQQELHRVLPPLYRAIR
jgi:S-formylglutathione hydrolase FrmB